MKAALLLLILAGASISPAYADGDFTWYPEPVPPCALKLACDGTYSDGVTEPEQPEVQEPGPFIFPSHRGGGCDAPAGSFCL